MSKSLKPWLILLVLLVAYGALWVALEGLPYGSRVTRANCDRIKTGMTEAEVRAILGKPWDNSLLDPDEPGASHRTQVLWAKQKNPIGQVLNGRFWSGNDLVVYVAFNPDGQVAFAQLLSEPDSSPSLPVRVWRRLRQRLGW